MAGLWRLWDFSENGVKEIVLPDTVFGVGDKEFDSYEGITFYVHKGSDAEKAVKQEGYTYKYLNNTSKPQASKRHNNKTNHQNPESGQNHMEKK